MEYKRICPKCTAELVYSNKTTWSRAAKKNSPCRSCNAIEINNRPGIRDDFIARYATKGHNTGKSNAFFGKRHTVETKQILSSRDTARWKTDDFRRTMSEVTSGSKNPMFGKTVYDIWVAKHGTEEANKKEKQREQKLSIRMSGSGNPMYGKPSPQGSGNGWSGWYKGWFFRSIRELSYMVNMLEKSGVVWRSAETKDLLIPYVDFKGACRTYSADFLVEERHLIEVKPIRLQTSKNVLLKQKAAEVFCSERGMSYSISDIEPLTDQEIRQLHNNGEITFTERYQNLYDQRIAKTGRIAR